MKSTRAFSRGYNDQKKGVTICPFKSEDDIHNWLEGFNKAYAESGPVEKPAPHPMNNIPEFKISLSSKVKASELMVVNSSRDAAEACRKVFDADTIDWVESFIVIALSKANKVIGFYKVSQGGVTGTVADPKVIMQFALLCNASSLIICHNHPSGNLRPSRQDEDLTTRIKGAANLFDIKLLDHIILTSESFTSFADDGIL